MPQMLLQPSILQSGLFDSALDRPRGAPGGIQFIAGGTAGANAGTISIPWPTAASPGDVALLFYATSSTSITTQPVGFTQMATAANGNITFSNVYQRVCDGTESGNISVTSQGIARSAMTLVIYRGLDPTTPIDQIQSFIETVSGTTHTPPSVTTAVPGDLIVTAINERSTSGTNNWIPPTGYIEREDTQSLAVGTGGMIGAWAEESPTTTHVSGATLTPGVWTSGNSFSSSTVVVWTLALSPIPAPAVALQVSLTDPGTGADALTVSAAVPLGDDPGTGADALTVSAALLLADTGSGADALTSAISISESDTGSGADAISVKATVPLAETGSGADAISVTVVTLSLTDTGSGADALTIHAAIPLADTGSGADALTVSILISESDTGSGADALTVSAAVPLTDTGSGADALTIRATVPLAETGSGADALAVQLPISLSETGTGADALSINILVSLSDSGSASDSINNGHITLIEGGLGTDDLTVIFDVPVPTGLRVAASSGTEIILTWNAAYGVTAYDVERDGVIIAAGVVGTTYFDDGLTPGSLHEYRVRSEQ